MIVAFKSDRFNDVKISLNISSIDNLTIEKRNDFLEVISSVINTLETIERYIIKGE